MTELEFKSLAAAGLQPHSADRRGLRRSRDAAVALPEAGAAAGAAAGRYSFLLESVVGGERFGRYSFIGLPARTLLRATGFRTEVVTDGRVVETDDGDPLDFIAAYQQRFKVALRPGLPRFCGGLAGYFGYDAVRYIEPRLAASAQARPLPDPIGTPDILLVQCEEVAVIDNLSGRLYLIVYADPAVPEAFATARRRLAELTDRLRSSVTAPAVERGAPQPVRRDFAKADFLAAVARAKEYIAAGDLMQVQVGQRLTQALRRLAAQPVPGAALAQSVAVHVLLRLGRLPDRRRLARDPGAARGDGRRRQGDDPAARRHAAARRDARARRARSRPSCAADPKERAEHLMLIDLARNDIGRIAKTGSVEGDRGVRGRALLARHAHRQQRRGRAAGRHDQPRRAARDLPGRHADRRAEDPGHGDHRRARARQARHLRRRLRLPQLRRRHGRGDRHPHRHRQGRHAARAGRRPASSPTRCAELEWQETEAKARALLRAAELVEEGF